jgi:uncharacterized membrane protein HdeD (DUF308 family)
MIVVLIGDWRTLALRGLATLAFGVVALLWPGLTLTALVILWGAFVLVDGVFMLADVLRGRTADHRATRAAMAGVSIAAGVLTFLWPAITALALLFVIAAWATLTGIAEISAAIRFRRELNNEWLLVLSGILSLAFAALLVVTPGAGAIAITWLIGWFAIVYGVVRFMLAWRVRRLEGAVREVGVSRRSRMPTGGAAREMPA